MCRRCPPRPFAASAALVGRCSRSSHSFSRNGRQAPHRTALHCTAAISHDLRRWFSVPKFFGLWEGKSTCHSANRRKGDWFRRHLAPDPQTDRSSLPTCKTSSCSNPDSRQRGLVANGHAHHDNVSLVENRLSRPGREASPIHRPLAAWPERRTPLAQPISSTAAAFPHRQTTFTILRRSSSSGRRVPGAFQRPVLICRRPEFKRSN
ncbi:hypothetical protein B0T22DRAFT_130942 [Podospora appendiculata]|uniref:Uncharacterized protein n=1 Tax=Podospora appendiculata TaxID=314037 RepID=A0AAE0X7H7_9PEZI|nr:hypothetical protein B0T22DRAFT_130942 [Podospora appendiculata]